MSIDDLAQQLQHGTEEERKHAAMLLGQSANPEAVPPLIAALHDPLRSVRRAVHECLIQLRDARAVEPLIDAAADGRLDYNAVAYSLERKFDVSDAYPRTLHAVEQCGLPDVIAAAKPVYERWRQRH